MLKCYIDNKEYKLDHDYTILQLCLKNNISLPRFCYHEKLSIAGNCRMCLVEVEKSPKPVASCAMSLVNNMRVYTNTTLVKKSRENVLEFLLANHPLDCPICDQGGECDLQDQAMLYGGDRGRFYELKRATVNKNIGPVVKTIMTRCIHCTRCIRFLSEIAGSRSFGTTGRGLGMEVGTYIDKILTTELSGNLVDLCPVGALTSKPYSFTARPWELSSVHSVDILDSLGSNLKIDLRGNQVLRVLPLNNFKLNEDWITDKVRYVYDGLRNQRIMSPMLRTQNNILFKASWFKVFSFLRSFVNFSNVNFVLGNLLESELILLTKIFANNFGNSNFVGLQNSGSCQPSLYNSDFGFTHFFNQSLSNLDSNDLIIIFNSNLRLEAPLVNTRIRKNYLRNNVLIASFGCDLNLTYYYKNLGSSTKVLLAILEGRHWICKALLNAKKPAIILGSSLFERNTILDVLDFLKILNNNLELFNINNFNVLFPFSSNLNALELGLFPGVNFFNNKNVITNKHIYYLLGADDFIPSQNADACFFIYQGHHGDKMAKKANVILPGFSFFEKSSTFLNLQGFSQNSNFVLMPVQGNSKNDWKILMNLLYFLKQNVNKTIFNSVNLSIFTNLKVLLYKKSFKFKKMNNFDILLFVQFANYIIKNKTNFTFKFANYANFAFIKDYFAMDSISRSSSVLSLSRFNTKQSFFNFNKNID